MKPEEGGPPAGAGPGAHRGPTGGERQRVLELGARSELFVELLDNLPGLLFLLDERGRYVFWNRNAERLLGYSPEEMDGRPGPRAS